MQKIKQKKQGFSFGNLLSYLFIFFLFTSFVFGQTLRVPLINGLVLSYIDIGTVFFAVMYLARLHQKNKNTLPYLMKPLLLFTVIAGLSLFVNARFLQPYQLLESSLYLLRFFSFACVYLLVSSFQKEQKNRILRGFLASGLGIVLLGFVQFFYYSNLRNLWYLGWDDHLYRMFSVFLDPNFAGVIFVLFFVFLLSLIFKATGDIVWNRAKACYACLATVTSLAIFLTYSRSALIMLVVSVVVFFALKKMYKILLVLLSIFFLFLFVSSDVKIEGLNPFRSVSSKARLDSVETALMIFEKNPLLGVGYNTYRFAQHRYGSRIGGAWETSHADSGTDNSFLFVLATTGVIGLTSFLFLFWKVVHLPLNNEDKPLFFSSVTGVIVSAFFLNTLFYPFIMLWIWTLFGVKENTSP